MTIGASVRNQASLSNLEAPWLTTLGQCLVCGGRGGYPTIGGSITLCPRCDGCGRDPQRASDWYVDLILPIQFRAIREQAEALGKSR